MQEKAKVFSLYGKKIYFTTEECISINVEKEYIEYAKKAANDFCEFYDSLDYKNPNIFENISVFVDDQVAFYMRQAVEFVTDSDNADKPFDFEYFRELVDELFAQTWKEPVEEIEEQYCALTSTQEELHYYREMRKAHRGKWSGGGFGIVGALKGAVEAQVLNAASGGVHSIVNKIGDIQTNHKLKNQIIDLFENSRDSLAKGFMALIYGMKILHIYALNQNNSMNIVPILLGETHTTLMGELENAEQKSAQSQILWDKGFLT
ncbi:hypothetical protein [Hespellia stercorisuis]|uniref:Uncharacterized protein n=1 Tax=Hespellia stercorisuis DSM 15480 TaxID=1121950 RepID=A0A1M6SUI3_9FIRM|nr:hypothetical protein [Hespellia stercorisuis]SHK48355.1 hypothetical protein SAMN02745243_03051 [Hespellia stercorisuis DSM 15480]